MRQLIRYAVIIAMLAGVWLLHGCASKDESNEKAAMEYSSDSVVLMEESTAAWASDMETDALQSDTITAEQLDVFTERAIQKLRDYDDYLRIIGDKKIDNEFRHEAMKQALGLFIDSSKVIFSASSRLLSEELQQIADNGAVIEAGKRDTSGIADFYTMKQGPIELKEHPQAAGENRFRGVLVIERSVMPSAHGPGVKSKFYEVDFYISKTRKQFGTETEEVWEVLLGDISRSW